MESERATSSPSFLKHKLRSKISCLRGGAAPDDERPSPPPLRRCSSAWLRSKAQELPELREKCRCLASRNGRTRRHSGDFSYDPTSYALNFDEGDEGDAWRFSSRLPASPPQLSTN